MKRQYDFKFKPYDKRTGLSGVGLKDGTWIVLDHKSKGLIFSFPKKKFSKIFQKQINDKKSEMLMISFSKTELFALSEGLDKIHMPKKHGSKAHYDKHCKAKIAKVK